MINRHLGLVLAGALSAATAAAQTQEQVVVVSASRVPQPSERIGSSITVIPASDVAARGAMDVSEALETVPGTHVARNGGIGRTAAVYLRGANSEHVIVLVNGVEVNDPLGFGRAADLAGLDVANIERIEVLRGPQSSLYGSDAMAGVINIITKRGKGEPRFSVSAEGGSYNTFREQASVSGSQGSLHYAVDASRMDTEGFSVADEADGNTENDGYGASTLSLRTGSAIGDSAEWEAFAQYVDEASDLDSSGMTKLGDSYSDTQDRRSLYTQGRIGLGLFDSTWLQTVKLGFASHERDYNSDTSRSTFDATMSDVDWQNDIHCSDNHTVTLGVAAQEETGESLSLGSSTNRFPEKSASTFGVYGEESFSIGDVLTGSAGARWDDHDTFGDKITWRIAPAYRAGESFRIKASYGTGFKAPSLYQLYSKYGSLELQPEESSGWDAGFEYTPAEGPVSAGITYFANDYASLIDFDYGSWTYINKANATTRGVEVYGAWQIVEACSVSLTYTYTEAEEDDGTPLDRRPKDRVALDLNTQPLKSLNLRVSTVYVGDRSDYDFTADQPVTLNDYLLVNVSTRYAVADNMTLSGRVENLFDEQYQEVFGYGTAGLSGYAGMEYTF